MMSYVVGALGIVVVLAGGAATIQTKRLEAAQKSVVLTEGQLRTCGGRLNAILRDVESDNEVDNLDLTDFDIPAGWLRRETPSGN